jgi:NDP-sugar pyrophosphorylase family protein
VETDVTQVTAPTSCELEEAPIGASSIIDATATTGIVLAGVHAWGHCPLEQVVCRPLFPVAGRPIVWHCLNWLDKAGVPQVTLCANSDTTLVQRAWQATHPLRIRVGYYEDVMPRGPAGCARDAAEQSAGSTFLVAHGTVIPRFDLASLLQAHAETRAALTVVATRACNGNGHADVPAEPVGIYVFTCEALHQVPLNGYQDIKETLIPRLHRQGMVVRTFIVPRSAVVSLTGSQTYLSVSRWALDHLPDEDFDRYGYHRKGSAWVHEMAVLGTQVRLVGPVLIGPGCRIGDGAVIIGPTSVDANSVIESNAVVSRSTVWEGSHVAHGAMVDQSVLTTATSVRAGAVVRGALSVPKKPLR